MLSSDKIVIDNQRQDDPGRQHDEGFPILGGNPHPVTGQNKILDLTNRLAYRME
jgi:hypothetical protein